MFLGLVNLGTGTWVLLGTLRRVIDRSLFLSVSSGKKKNAGNLGKIFRFLLFSIDLKLLDILAVPRVLTSVETACTE